MLWCLTYTTLFFCHVSLYEQEGKGKGNPGWRVVFGTNRSNQISVLLLIYPVHREVSLKYDSPEKRTQHKKRRARFMCAGCEWWWYGGGNPPCFMLLELLQPSKRLSMLIAAASQRVQLACLPPCARCHWAQMLVDHNTPTKRSVSGFGSNTQIQRRTDCSIHL